MFSLRVPAETSGPLLLAPRPPARKHVEQAELTQPAPSPLGSRKARLALLALAEQRALARIIERDIRDMGQTGHTLRNQNLSTSFNGAMLMQPPFQCPLDLSKSVSARQQWDGGKWMCGLRALSRRRHPWRNCTVLSIGSNFDASFEAFVQSRARARKQRCDIHIFDPTLEKAKGRLDRFKAFLRDKGIGQLHEVALASSEADRELVLKGRRVPARTLPQLIQDTFAGDARGCVDILKFDVEGTELGVLRNTPWRQLCVGLLLFELHPPLLESTHVPSPHVPGWRGTHGYVPGGPLGALTDIRRLEAAGFMLYSSEMVCGRCRSVELALINVTWAKETIEHSD